MHTNEGRCHWGGGNSHRWVSTDPSRWTFFLRMMPDDFLTWGLAQCLRLRDILTEHRASPVLWTTGL